MTQPVFGFTIERIDTEPRPAVAADFSVAGLIGTAPDAAGAAAASLTVGSGNAGLVLTAATTGAAGNALTVAMVDPGAADAALSVAVDGPAITIDLATDGAGSVASTAAEVSAALGASGAASGAASALVSAAYPAGSDGSALVTPLAATALSGGADAPFPLDTPVLINSTDDAALTALGAGGTLRDAIVLLNAQLGAFNTSALVVVVRVAPGVDEAGTIANIVGDGISTGVHAFLDAPERLGVTPRLLAAPGFTAQRLPGQGNAVCAALPAICASLLAHAVVDGPGTTLAEAKDWRETLASDRIVPVDPGVLVRQGDGVVTLPLSPAVIGLGIRRDNENGGRPFTSWANQAVFGIVGPSRAIRFSILDGATEGQQLLSANIGVLVRGEGGVDGALTDGGFTFVGTDTAGTDDLWRFYNVTRGRDYIHLLAIKTLRQYLGRFNITGQTIQAILNTLELALRDLKADNDILGYRVQFVRDQNAPENLRAGRLVIDFQAEEAPVLRHMTIRSARYRAALDELVENLV